MKEEALKLADESQRQSSLVYLVADEPIAKQMSQMFLNYSAMIRRLVEELDKQEYRNKHEGFSTIIDKVAPQTKSLSNDEINEIAMYCSDMNEYGHSKLDEFAFARAIEERHGIK